MTHDNCPNCHPGQPCRAHSVIQDGEVHRVSMTMMDSMQRDIAARFDASIPRTDDTSILSPRYAAAIQDCINKQAQIQAHADHWKGEFAAMDEFKARDPSYQSYANGRD